MPDIDLEIRRVPAQRVATLTRHAPGFGSQQIGPVVGPMFPEAAALLGDVPTGPAVALYRSEETGDGVVVTAGFEVGDDVGPVPGLELHVLPELERAAVAEHHGAMDVIDRSWEALAAALRALAGPAREVYLTPPDRPQEEWVTRLIQPVARPR
ncbi:GyrI-like domain-containing protein [Amnibacterium setariae]|uniref:GyrI-like domain-containing protein n=1 Tax=Amnibacterium setariae TaxID=2306585 RepID=UPI001313DAFC|nr:GyrI-like domain-containing protein [Amnibacterium setariae]